eukprot:TRINITY_DN30532_c0_g1_i2.p1 TRINITY_DN30532_c0_g1~~TRINITY_DN30532_c0_g1_i2.p1  ORF type:complete len:528 (+),score=134.58 TRINITY_DN30532_c0_g1_i2:102-1685(+)
MAMKKRRRSLDAIGPAAKFAAADALPPCSPSLPSRPSAAAVAKVGKGGEESSDGSLQQLAELLKELIPSASYEQAVKEAAGALAKAVSKTFGAEARVLLFGSILQGAHLPDSDLDICLHVPGLKALSKKSGNREQVQALRRLLQKLPRQMFNIVETRLFATIRVPIVILRYWSYSGENVEVDVSVGASFDGVEKGFTDKLVRRLLSQAPARCISMVRIVKQWAKIEGVNKAYDGYLNSLGWTLLVIYFYMLGGAIDPSMMEVLDAAERQSLPPPLSTGNDCTPPPVSDVVGFFELVASLASFGSDYSDDDPPGVSVVSGGPVSSPSDTQGPLFIEDPGPRLATGKRENVARALRDHAWRGTLRKCRVVAKTLKSQAGFVNWLTALVRRNAKASGPWTRTGDEALDDDWSEQGWSTESDCSWTPVSSPEFNFSPELNFAPAPQIEAKSKRPTPLDATLDPATKKRRVNESGQVASEVNKEASEHRPPESQEAASTVKAKKRRKAAARKTKGLAAQQNTKAGGAWQWKR